MKKLNKLFAILVAMAMVLSLGVVSAFAVAGGKTYTEEDNPEVKITKALKVPTGTTPVGTYTFKFTEKTEDNPSNAISDVTATFSGEEEGVVGTGEDTGYTFYYTMTENIFNKAGEWPDVGVYTYTVKEEKGDATTTDTKDGRTITTTYTYDEVSTYTLQVGVARGADNELYVQSVSVKDKDDHKVDLDEGDNGNGFVFNNSLTKKISNITPEGRDEDEDDSDKAALAIEKLVIAKGDTEKKEIATNTQDFAFTLKVTAPANVAADTIYPAQIISADGETVKKDVQITAGEDYPFTLRTGERLVFKELDVGAAYTIKEDDYPQYEESYGVDTTTAVVIGDNGAYNLVTNEYDKDKDPQTGLSIANLPFIVLALVAVGGLVAYVIVRRKSEDNA